jgi:hypothetical protein
MKYYRIKMKNNLHDKNHKKWVKYQVMLFLLFFTHSIEGQVKFSGYGSTGFRNIERPRQVGFNQEVYFEGKLQADIKINKNLEAQLDFRGNSVDERVTLREFSAKFEYWDQMKIKAGNIRQPFGTEQLINRDEYFFIDRSFIHNKISDYGYAQRAVSIMVYSKYSDKYKEFPFSYYASLFRNNSLTWGGYTRLSFHKNKFIYSVNYTLQSIGGDYPITGHGLSGDVTYETESTTSSFEVFYIKNTERVLQLVTLQGEKNIFAAGTNLLVSHRLGFDSDIVKIVEPIVLLGYFAPDFTEKDLHTLQLVPGMNLYFHKDFRLRFNYSLLLTKNRYVSDYSTINSVGTIELQIRF